MKFVVLLSAATLTLTLAACGGGGEGSPVTEPPEQPPESVRPADPDPQPEQQTNLDFPLEAGAVSYVGIHQSVSGNFPTQSLLGGLPEVGRRGAAAIRYGALDDGAGYSLVKSYLSDVALYGDEVSRFTSAPVVRVVTGASERERRLVAEAVETINLSLPTRFKIHLGPDVPNTDGFEDGTIDVRFLSCAEFRRCGSAAASTGARVSRDAAGEQTSRSADVLVARGSNSYPRDDEALTLVTHELLHALGLDHHVEFWLSSIMQSSSHHKYATPSVLTALDREVLAALYRRLSPGDGPGDFGPWSSSSTHLAGNGAHANFGVAARNGYAEPWAHGPAPVTTLARNGALRGIAEWEGALVGLTPAGASVTGDALVGVDLTTLRGRAIFDALEQWAGAPGAEGTGRVWLDGDLAYQIAVDGNTFHRTGGDAGVLMGVFVGRSHEGAAGTLERSDLTAAFGAER